MQVRTTDLARALACDPTLISRWARRGMPVDSVEAARAWHASNIRSRVRIGAPPPAEPANRPAKGASGPAATAAAAAGGAVAPSDENVSGDYHVFRVRRERAESGIAEMREAEMRGELIRLSAVKNALGIAFATARESLLQLPSRLAPQLAGETDPATIQNLLYVEIHQTLVQLSGAGDRLGKPTDSSTTTEKETE